MVTKKELRLQALEIRKNINYGLSAFKIINQIRQSDLYKNAKNIMLYYPISNELDLTSLMDDYDKNFYLPKVVDDALEVRPFKVGDRLVAGHFNVLEPLTEAVEPEILDIVFIPALMVDSKKQRLGYGKGYYDRFLPNLSDKCKTIVAISSKLLIQEIPSEEFDIPVDFVVTD